MNDKDFQKLVESVKQMGSIMRGQQIPHRCTLKVIDEDIAEVRTIRRATSERHGNDIDRLLDALITKERESGSAKIYASPPNPSQASCCSDFPR